MSDTLKHTYAHFLLSESDLEEIIKAHELISIPKNSHLLVESCIANEYYILQEGLVRAYVHDFDNNEITTEFFTEGEIVIIPSSLFQRIPSQENLQTITDCILWKIDYEIFQKLFHSISGLSEWGRLWFTYQLFTTKQRSLDMIMKTAKTRYLNLLKEKPQILQNVPLKQIASYLGITDTSLSRIRKEIIKQ